MSHPPLAPNSLCKLKINSSFAVSRRLCLKRLTAWGSARRASGLLVLFALITTIFYTGASAAAPSSPGDHTAATARLQFGAPRPAAGDGVGAWLLSPAMFQLFPAEELTTYALDCTTRKTDFNLGDKVCVRATFPPAFFSFRSITLVDPDNHIVDTAFVTTNGQTHVFTLPGSATSVIGDNTVDNRGAWRIDMRWADGSRSATAAFDMHELQNPRADLQISVGNEDGVVGSGSEVSVKVILYNAGPDTATNIAVTAFRASGLSLQSLTDGLGASCSTGGVCAVANLSRGERAFFIATYNVTAPAGGSASAAMMVASDTEDPRSSSNADAFAFPVSQATLGNQNCTLTCPGPINASGAALPDPDDPSLTVYGAVVNYAVDAEGTSCSPVQCDVPSGSIFPAGTTLVTCSAPTGDSCIFPVTVSDTRSFQINLNGTNPMTVGCNTTPPFADPGATTNRPGITPTVTTDVDPNKPGTYTITYTATDGTNTATATRTVNVIDDAPPQIILAGDDPATDELETQELTIECHANFVDPGATASDACSGTVPLSVNSNVDPNTVGTYTITYSATDQHGTPDDLSDDLTATLTRTVHVVDTTAPVITLTGGNVLTAECHVAFVDPGATATDSCAGDLNSAIQVSGAVNPNMVGTYTLTYTVRDAAGNLATAERTVNVVDTTAPVITLAGDSPATVECHTSYTDPGATAEDACGGAAFPVIASGSVDVNTPGTYTITYTTTDGTNTGTATRTVNVVDTTAPVISCPADIVVTLDANSAATSKSVSFNVEATDSCGGAHVVTSRASGANFPVGTTIVDATATDQAGNTSTCSFKVSVRYLFTGFFSPVSNLPVLNTVNAGRAIPVKFSLSGNKGLNILAADFPASGAITCNSTDPAAEVTETTSAGGSSLGYDAGSDRYQYIWKTESAWAGTCRQLVIKLDDGTEHRANFKFK